jgi:hypothetical protein
MSEMKSKRTIVAYVKVLPVHLPIGKEEQHENLSEHRVSEPKFEIWTVQIRSSIAQTSATMFDVL